MSVNPSCCSINVPSTSVSGAFLDPSPWQHPFSLSPSHCSCGSEGRVQCVRLLPALELSTALSSACTRTGFFAISSLKEHHPVADLCFPSVCPCPFSPSSCPLTTGPWITGFGGGRALCLCDRDSGQLATALCRVPSSFLIKQAKSHLIGTAYLH